MEPNTKNQTVGQDGNTLVLGSQQSSQTAVSQQNVLLVPQWTPHAAHISEPAAAISPATEKLVDKSETDSAPAPSQPIEVVAPASIEPKSEPISAKAEAVFQPVPAEQLAAIIPKSPAKAFELVVTKPVESIPKPAPAANPEPQKVEPAPTPPPVAAELPKIEPIQSTLKSNSEASMAVPVVPAPVAPTQNIQPAQPAQAAAVQPIVNNSLPVVKPVVASAESAAVNPVEPKKSFLQKFWPSGKKSTAVTAAPAKAAAPTKPSKAEEATIREAERIYNQGLASIKDLIAPSSFEVHYNHLRLSGTFARSFFVYTYPRYLDTNWLSPVINFDATFEFSQFIYPISSEEIMQVLKKKVAQIQSSITISREKGNVRDPVLETALEDAEQLRTDIQRGQEKFFQFGMYFTVYAEDEKKLETVTKQFESILGGKLVLTKRADIQGEHAFNSTTPLCLDELEVQRNMNTSPLSTTFPFVSSDLTSDEGILYGLNRHNDSLVIFDRFKLPNANSVVFATSGAGKSYAVKLEILRTMMLGTDVIVIDPENEYEDLSQAVGGSYLRVSLNSEQRINPFDLAKPVEDQDERPGDLLRSNIITLTGLMKLMLGNLTDTEQALLEKALLDTYAVRGITMDTENPGEIVPPTMEDFYSVVSSIKGAESIAQRLQKYTTGTFGGIFNKPTNVDLDSGMVVFCIRDLEDELRPIATYIILHYIWNRVRSSLKRRMLVIDEAWSMMQHEDSAKFLHGLIKRARKYYLGITTITQDVEDFLRSPYGKPVVTNSSMALLLKQAPSSMEVLQKTFNLTDGEKYMLLNSGVGQGLFFADRKHVATQIIASYSENQLVTTNPEEKLAQKTAAASVFAK
jgi:hypothetical protein